MSIEFTRYENVYNQYYRVERCGAISLSDGGGPFGFDILIALLFDDLVAAYNPDCIVECGSSVGDTTVYLANAYTQIAVTACDTDPFCTRVAAHRTRAYANVSVTTEKSVSLIKRVTDRHERPLIYLDAHGGSTWPLLAELEQIMEGIAVIHDFDIGHPRFCFGSYEGVACNSSLLAKRLPEGKTFYQFNPSAQAPFPCLQVGRRTGVAVVPQGVTAEQACAAVARGSRQAMCPKIVM